MRYLVHLIRGIGIGLVIWLAVVGFIYIAYCADKVLLH